MESDSDAIRDRCLTQQTRIKITVKETRAQLAANTTRNSADFYLWDVFQLALYVVCVSLSPQLPEKDGCYFREEGRIVGQF